ncbi:MAG TPA: carboxypeptidase regulatory-like domain-containing protein, partial [Thermoplasmatales archaeon]|nr:carboxypeptidase regulatory-like domain-containing protein [Thermoplasmatales archaeon]
MRKIECVLVAIMLLASITGMIMESRALDQPFPVYGYIKDSDGDALPAGVSVVVKDITKGTQITVATQAGGYYQADLFNLENCEDGDSIEVSCSYNNEENSKVFTLNVAETSKNISFNLIGSPSVSTKAATNIAGTSAKLNGQLTDLGGASSCE